MSKTEKSQSPETVKLNQAAASANGKGSLLFNRELSWLEFNHRVLEEAMDDNLPVLERLKFLSIFSTNLDEFFMIRVSGLKEQVAEGIIELSPDGLTASEQLTELSRRLRPMLKKQVSYLHNTVLPALAESGITIEHYKDLKSQEKKRLDKYFRDNLLPVLTPQAVDASHKFPYISNLSLNLGLFIEPDDKNIQENLKHLFRQKRFARIKLPPNVLRLVPIDEKKRRFAMLGEVIAANVHHLFPNMKCGECHLFRVTRDADMELREDEAGDLLRTLEHELHRQRFGFAVRLEIEPSMPDKILKILTEGIGLNEQDVYAIDGFLNIPDLMQLYSIDKPQLKDKPIPYVNLSILREKKIFDVLKKRDLLLHHPYTAYSTVTDFIAAAATDKDVQAIKICLYRTGKDSPVVKSLIQASQLGKQVTALVELKARFDEENNIEWARRLENEGVHVVYGIHTLKTHSKVTLIVRREKDKLARYVHLATGNYNPTTSRIYTDLGLLTSDEEIGAEVTNLFNFLTGYSLNTDYRCLLVAPINLRERLIKLIQREVSNKSSGKEARIIVKTNSLTDVDLIQELYKASQAGVEIDLIVRGICALRPGVKDVSENIRVRSIVGRFLEHSRIFYFENSGAEAEVYIGSADWMMRNLDRRVEVIVPIKDIKIRQYLKENILDVYLRDSVNARILRSDGTYKKVSAHGAEPFSAQMHFVGQDIKT